MKKLIALLLAVVMCAALAVPAFAAFRETDDEPWFVSESWFEELNWFEKQAWYKKLDWFTPVIWG